MTNHEKGQAYKIWGGRFDVVPIVLEQFHAETDEEAIAYFNNFCKTPAYAWEKMSLEACAVIEIIKPTRNLANNFDQNKKVAPK